MSQPKRIKWYKVFDSEEAAVNAFPDQRVIKVMLGEKFVCFSRNGRRFFAFDDKCPHQGKPLVQGSCTDNDQVLCPFHQYSFDLHTGRGHGLYLQVYPVEKREDGIYVGVEKSRWSIF